ncbi:MAG: pseudouridine synthase [Sulfuricurvum sp.]|jgi:23S rRNA pseudouridine2605 synthase
MRLNKFIAHNSSYSRREADAAIEKGFVRVNGEVVKELGTIINERRDKVFVSGKRVSPQEKYTVIVYNKPKGEIVSKNDPQGRRTIYDSLSKEFRHFKPVGRLDFASEGLLLLSDASRVVTALMDSKVERVYKLKIRGEVTPAMVKAMQEGLDLDDATAGAHPKSEITAMNFKPFLGFMVQKSTPSNSVLKVAISEGQNRELRRFFAHFKAEVSDLKRLSFAHISLNNLPTGKTRYLDKEEYSKLHKLLDELGVV